MNLQKISELNHETTKFPVPDQISRGYYFVDAETSGWVIVHKETEDEVYLKYRRASDPITGELVEEDNFFPAERLTSETLNKELANMKQEAQLIKENTGSDVLLEAVENLRIP